MTDHNGNTILVIDDEHDLVNILSLILKDYGYNVVVRTEVHNIESDVRAIKPDLILLDIRLFDGDGFAITRLLKGEEDTRHIPIVLMSARVDNVRGEELCGAEAFLAKPFQIQEMVGTIQYLLSDRT